MITSSQFQFNEWLVGFVDGDGSFVINNKGNSTQYWNFSFKVSQSSYNYRALYYIKRQLGYGSIIKSNKETYVFQITNRTTLLQIICPIFDKHPLKTKKYYNYLRFKKCLLIAEDISIPFETKSKIIADIMNEYKQNQSIIKIAPIWSEKNTDTNILTKSWITGFIEAEGSFFISKKDKNRYAHRFGIVQKDDKQVLEAIGKCLGIPTKVQTQRRTRNENETSNNLSTSNSRAIAFIGTYFTYKDNKHTWFKGMKAVEFRIWINSFKKEKGNFLALQNTQNKLRKLRELRDHKIFQKK